MFTRIVEVTTKSGKSNEVANAINKKILPFLRQQPGFLDETVLTSETESNRVIGISFWKTKEDAERYSREQFSEGERDPRRSHRVDSDGPHLPRPHLNSAQDRRRQSRVMLRMCATTKGEAIRLTFSIRLSALAYKNSGT
jgi:heme-degrading monooxygenase HmoA